MRSPGRTPLTLLATTVAVAGWLMVPARLHAQAAQEPDLVPFAQAYTNAWNAHDLDAVLAFFAPDAVVRERRGDVPLPVWDTRDPQVVHDYLAGSQDGDYYDAGGLAWATGPRQIASWATARLAKQHRHAAAQHRAVGSTVSWPYQEFGTPAEQLPGVGPLEGTAEVVVRDGRITGFTLVLSPESVARQWWEVVSYTGQMMATQRTAPSAPVGGSASGQSGGLLRDGPAAAEPTTLAWPLALGGLALLASVVAGRRRRASQSTVRP